MVVDANVGEAPDDFATKLATVPLQKRLGAFYTPDHVAAALVRWALDGRPGRLLEPSFGGCSFLRASLEELERLGGTGSQIVGIDIDPVSTNSAAAELIASGLPVKNLIYQDFLALVPHEVGRFSAVVGNPPFVRHHWLHPDWQRDAQQAIASTGIELSQRASAWAYFVVHAVEFVETAGRLAFVLPGAMLQASYADSVVRFLEGRFDSVRLLRLRERLFADAEEEAVILLASGRGSGTARALVEDVGATSALDTMLSAASGSPVADIKTGLLTTTTRALLTRALADPRVMELRDIASVRIGVVTGANEFFVRPMSKLPGVVGTRGVPVVSRSAWLKRPVWDSDDLAEHDEAGDATRLLVIDKAWRRRGVLATQIAEAETAGVDARSHCKRRGGKWWVLHDVRAPHAFLPYMGATPRGLVRNESWATCTNAVHRVDFTSEVAREVVCASTWTSLYSVCAELYGRHYGGGVLKLEPSAAKDLPVITHLTDRDGLSEANRLFAAGDGASARAQLDDVFLRVELGMTATEIKALQQAAKALRDWRVQASKSASEAPG